MMRRVANKQRKQDP